MGEAPRRSTLLLLALMVGVSLTEGVGILMLVPLLDALRGDPASGFTRIIADGLGALGLGSSLGALLMVFVAVVVARGVLLYAQTLQSSAYQYQLIDGLRLRAFAGLMTAEWRWLSTRRAADHSSVLLSGVGRIAFGLNQALALLVSLLGLAVCISAAMVLSWKIAFLAVVGGGVVLALFAKRRNEATELGHQIGAANRAMHAVVAESLAGVRLTKILQNEPRQIGRFAGALEDLRRRQLRFTATSGGSRLILQSGGAVLLAGLLYAGVTWAQAPLPRLLVIVLVFGRLVPMLSGVQQQLHNWMHAVPALADIDALMAESARAADPPAQAAAELWAVERDITLRHVTLTYAGRDRPALADVTLTIPARTTTAIVGPSGAGKSSLADVLMGLIEADSGTLSVDGRTVSGAARRTWQRSVAYVQQDAFLFNDSIRGNLLWARPDASEEDLRRALVLASADFVWALPQGIDTVVGDGGVRISGGERQRLALARALLGKPALLILDEATSALDHANEAAVRRAVAGLHGDLTIVVIGHRLAMLDEADQVIALDGGRVAMDGGGTPVAGP